MNLRLKSSHRQVLVVEAEGLKGGEEAAGVGDLVHAEGPEGRLVEGGVEAQVHPDVPEGYADIEDVIDPLLIVIHLDGDSDTQRVALRIVDALRSLALCEPDLIMEVIVVDFRVDDLTYTSR